MPGKPIDSMSEGPPAFHLQPEAVDLVLSGLVQHVLVSLPANWVQAAGIRPNVSDRFGPKRLWVGRLRHLRLLLRAETLRKATVPARVRDHLNQEAQKESSSVDVPREKVELLVRLVELPNDRLERLARAIMALQRAFRRMKTNANRRKRARKELPEEADKAAMEILQDAFHGVPTKGYVIYLCGSTGIVGDSFRYLRMMAGMGFVALAPDMMVSAAVKGSTLRTRQPKTCMLLDTVASDYWSKTSLYADNSSCAGEMVYSSQADAFMTNPEDFNRMYSNIITLRQAELAHVLRLLPSSFRRQGVTLIGSSEGAVVLSSFQDEPFVDILNSRVILAYPCEANYWTYFRPEDAGIAGDSSIPTLNLIGCDDQYFGRTNSVAAKVAESSDLPAVRGHAFETMVEKGLSSGLVCHFEGAVHTLLRTHDSVVREILSDFLQRPAFACRKLPVHWERFSHLQSLIRRYRRHHEGGCNVLYVRICAPKQAQVVDISTSKQHRELLDRIEHVIYKSAPSLSSQSPTGSLTARGDVGQQTKLSLERMASIINVAHTSTEYVPVHTALQLSQNLPDFVERVEEQLEVLLHEEPHSLEMSNKSTQNPREVSGQQTAAPPAVPAPPPAADATPQQSTAKTPEDTLVGGSGRVATGVRHIQRQEKKGTAVNGSKHSAPARGPAVVPPGATKSPFEPLSNSDSSQPARGQAAPVVWAAGGDPGLAMAAVAEAIVAHGKDVRQGAMCLAVSAACCGLAGLAVMRSYAK